MIAIRPFSIIALLAVAAAAWSADDLSTYASRIQPLLASYCTDCHGSQKQKAKLDFSGHRSAD